MAIVVGPSSDNRIELLDDLFDGRLFVVIQNRLELFEVALDFFFLWLAQKFVFEAANGESQEVEPFLYMDNSGLFLIQLQSPFSQKLRQLRDDVLFQYLSVRRGDDKVIGIPVQTDPSVLAFSFGWGDVAAVRAFASKHSFHAIQGDVCQQWADDAPLWRPALGWLVLPPLYDACFEPTADGCSEYRHSLHEVIV